MTTKRDYYEVLGVARDADGKTIKDAYHAIAMETHPDKTSGNAEAEERFEEAAEAYAVLGDPERRAAYDKLSAFRVPSSVSDLFLSHPVGQAKVLHASRQPPLVPVPGRAAIVIVHVAKKEGAIAVPIPTVDAQGIALAGTGQAVEIDAATLNRSLHFKVVRGAGYKGVNAAPNGDLWIAFVSTDTKRS